MPNAVYDPDSDQQHHDDLGVHPEHREAELADLENQFNAPTTPDRTYGSTPDHHEDSAPKNKAATSGGDLKKAEESPPDRSGFSAADDMREKLGLGYTGKGSNKSKILSKLYSSDKKMLKRAALAASLAGGSLIGGSLLFLAMLPLKIENIMQNVDSHFGASSENALDNETENLFDKYMVKNVFPNLGKGTCHSTIDLSCNASSTSGNSPISKLYNSWKDARLENKLANNYGLAFGKKNGQYYMINKGETLNLGNGDSIFGDSRTSAATKAEMRQAVRDALKEGTFYDKVFTRFKAYKLLESKYGVRRCVTTIGCTLSDKFHDTVAEKKLAAKAYVIQRVVTPISSQYGIILQCLIGGGSTCDSTTPSDDESVDQSGDQEKTSQFEQDLQSQLDQYAATLGDDALKDVLSKVNTISEKGWTTYLLETALEKMGIQVGEDSAVEDAVPVVGWITAAANLVQQLNGIGPKLKALNYAVASAGAVELYMTYRNVADEAKTGNIDATELGSFTNTLGDDTQLDGKGSDVTQTPEYANVMGSTAPTTTSSIFSDIFGGAIASAASVNPNASNGTGTYLCNNGKPVPAGQTVCPEEVLDGGGPVTNAIQNIENQVPGWSVLATAAHAWNISIGAAFNAIQNLGSTATNWILSHLPGFSDFQSFIAGLIKPLLQALATYLIPSPFSTDMSGGRTGDMIMAGSDVSNNESCQVQMGCASISNKQVAMIQNQQLAEQKSEFDSMSLVARVFDTNSTYSLVSRLAMDMPTSTLAATDTGLSYFLSNPFGHLANSLASIFSTDRAFAATTAQSDPFGVAQTGYTSVPSDPQAYWDQNCVNGPMATYNASTNSLDVSKWLDAQPTNPDTGQAEATTPNPCLLIQSSVQSAGGMFDDSLLPQGSGS